MDAIGDDKTGRLQELQREIEENLDHIEADAARADTIVQQMLVLGETQGSGVECGPERACL